MSYNLQSLTTILQQILNPEQEHWILDDHSKPQLESLLQKAASLMQILEISSAPKIESLEIQIRDAALKAEDLIESHMVDLMLSHEGTRFTFVTPDLQEVTQELDSTVEKVEELMKENKMSSGSSCGGVAFLPDPTSKSVVVGVDNDLFQLKDRLTQRNNRLEIVPIVGMGGIGKTTLARKLYDDPLIVYHFEFCAWTTISQDYNVRAILLGLLRRPNEKLSNELIQCQDHELKEILRKRLYARRYLIVLDDIWSTKCWDDIKWCFPDNNNGSQIVLTTRESNVAGYVGKVGSQHELRLLEESDSWDLLQQTVFGKEDCPYALVDIGRKIARDCGGLPLAIRVIGGVLCKAKRARDVWAHVAKDVRATIAESGDHEFSNVLSLSYNHLPNNLKPCFLYLGAFPEDYEMKAARLIQLLVAEGFLKLNEDKSLEEGAEDSLSALVERNLLLVTRKKSNGKALRYGMHDLLREVCIRKADEENFLHVKNGSEVRLDKLRRVSVETSCGMKDVDAYASAQWLSVARSFICSDSNPMLCKSPSLLFFKLILVRVLDVYEMKFREFPREIYELVNLRYLAVYCKSGGIPTGISRLWYLQTLIARVEFGADVSSEVWEMSELRHLKLKYTIINIEEGYTIKFVREKLQTIWYVRVTGSLMRSGFFESIPNIENLGVYFPKLTSTTEVVDLSHLHKLRTFRCDSVLNEDAGCRFLLQKLIFPSSLRNLTLFECVIFGGFMTTLCALPNLEVLRIGSCVFEENEEWEAAEGDEFGSLQHLMLARLNLVRWRADETNFPRLKHLAVANCHALEEIPSGIGEIPTLQLIEVYQCSPSIVASAKQIQELQQSEFDNYDLQVQIINDD